MIHDARFAEEVEKALGKYCSVKNVITVGGGPNKSIKYESFIANQPIEEPIPDALMSENDHICYLYTGGTTGSPKAAVRSHRSMYMVALLFSIEFTISRNGKGLVAGPLYGAAALSISMPNFFVGNPIHIVEKFHPVEVLEAIDKEQATTTFLAPPMLDAIFSLPEEMRRKYDVSSMKSIISVGAPLLSGQNSVHKSILKM